MHNIIEFDAHPNQQAKRRRAAATVKVADIGRYWDDRHDGWRAVEVLVTYPLDAA